jgi:hypothetical protein
MFGLELLLELELALMEPTKLINLVLVFTADLDLIPSLGLVLSGKLSRRQSSQ